MTNWRQNSMTVWQLPDKGSNIPSCSSHQYRFFFCCGAATQRGSWPSHSWGFLDHTQRRFTVGRIPLDEWSARRRDLYLTTHNTHNRQTSLPPVGFEPTISTGEWPQTYVLDRAATGTDINIDYKPRITQHYEYYMCIYTSHSFYAFEMCVLIFNTTFVRNITHSKKKRARYDHKCILVFMQSTRYACPIWMQLNFSTDFLKILKCQISRKSIEWEASCSIRTDGEAGLTKFLALFQILGTHLKTCLKNLIQEYYSTCYVDRNMDII